MKKLFFLIAFALFAVGFTSCSNDDNDTPTPSTDEITENQYESMLMGEWVIFRETDPTNPNVVVTGDPNKGFYCTMDFHINADGENRLYMKQTFNGKTHYVVKNKMETVGKTNDSKVKYTINGDILTVYKVESYDMKIHYIKDVKHVDGNYYEMELQYNDDFRGVKEWRGTGGTSVFRKYYE